MPGSAEAAAEEITVATLDEFPEFEEMQKKIEELESQLEDQKAKNHEFHTWCNRLERSIETVGSKLKKAMDERQNVVISMDELTDAIASRMVAEFVQTRAQKIMRRATPPDPAPSTQVPPQ